MDQFGPYAKQTNKMVLLLRVQFYNSSGPTRADQLEFATGHVLCIFISIFNKLESNRLNAISDV